MSVNVIASVLLVFLLLGYLAYVLINAEVFWWLRKGSY